MLTPTSGYNDGFGGCAGGTPQLPNLLNGYAARPAWKVAGVDYAVGVPTGKHSRIRPSQRTCLPAFQLTRPITSSTLLATTSRSTALTSRCTVVWGISIQSGVTGTTVENCNFSMLANQVVGINAASGSGSLTVLDCTFNGNSENIPSVQPPPAGGRYRRCYQLQRQRNFHSRIQLHL